MKDAALLDQEIEDAASEMVEGAARDGMDVTIEGTGPIGKAVEKAVSAAKRAKATAVKPIEIQGAGTVALIEAPPLSAYAIAQDHLLYLDSVAERVHFQAELALSSIIQAGKLLNEAQGIIGQRYGVGAFWAWVREKTDVPETMARRWMAAASNEGFCTTVSSVFGLGLCAIYELVTSYWPDEIKTKLLAGETVEIPGAGAKSLHDMTVRELQAVRQHAVEVEKRNKELQELLWQRDAAIQALRVVPPKEIEVEPKDYKDAIRERDVLREQTETLTRQLAAAQTALMEGDRADEQRARATGLQLSGIYLSSVWHHDPVLQYAGDPAWPQATPIAVVEQVVRRYTSEGDLVVDPLAGSGTVLDVCRVLKRVAAGSDLEPRHSDVEIMDAVSIESDGGIADLVFVHLPSPRLLRSGGDLGDEKSSRLELLDPQRYATVLGQIMAEISRILKPGKYLAVYTAEHDPAATMGDYIDVARITGNVVIQAGFREIAKAVYTFGGAAPGAYQAYGELEGMRPDHGIVKIYRRPHTV
jgi:hypothetical protein